MKSQLIIANWLLSFLFLAYNGDSIILTFLVVVYFSLASYLLIHYKQKIVKEIAKMDRKISHLISRFEVNR